MKTFIINDLIVHSENETYKNGYIKVVDGKIAEVGPVNQYKHDDDVKVITLSSDYQAIPGAIDIHIHGASNFDAMDATHEALSTMAETLPKEGTTSFLATTMTQTTEAIESALLNAGKYIENQSQEHAEIIGVHLEGPFISPVRKGAQPEEHIVDPDVTLFKGGRKWPKIKSSL